MAELVWFDKEVTLEDYVKNYVLKNDGTHTNVQAFELKHILDKNDIKYKKTATKKEMLELLYKHYGTWQDVARILKIGVKVNQYVSAFPFVTAADIKRLEKFEAIKLVGFESFRAYGKTLYASLYDLEEFHLMTEERMRELLAEHPKGKRRILKKQET